MARTGRPVGLQLETLQAVALVIALEAAGFSRRRHKLVRLADALASVRGWVREADVGAGLNMDPGPRAENHLEELSKKLGDTFWQQRHADWPETAAREMEFVGSSARVLSPMFRYVGANIEVRAATLLGLGWDPQSVNKVRRFSRRIAAVEQRANRTP